MAVPQDPLFIPTDRMVRRKEMLQFCGLSYSSVVRGMRDGSFPKAKRIGRFAVAWTLSSLCQWAADREVVGGGGHARQKADGEEESTPGAGDGEIAQRPACTEPATEEGYANPR